MIKRIFKKPHLFSLIIIFVVYLVLAVILSGFYNTFKLILIYANTVNWFELGISIFLTLLIGFLVAVNSVLAYIKYKERKRCKEGIATAGAGTVGGLIVGVCPLCVTGLVPLILSLLGVTFTFASLPLKGIEIQVLVVAILLISFRMLRKK
jgi:hypothetical protein